MLFCIIFHINGYEIYKCAFVFVILGVYIYIRRI